MRADAIRTVAALTATAFRRRRVRPEWSATAAPSPMPAGRRSDIRAGAAHVSVADTRTMHRGA